MPPLVTRSAARALARTTLTGPSSARGNASDETSTPATTQSSKRPAVVISQSALQRYQGIPRSASQQRAISSIFQRDDAPVNLGGAAEPESQSIPQKRVRDTSSSPEARNVSTTRGQSEATGPTTTTDDDEDDDNDDDGGFDHIENVLEESEEDSSVDGTTIPLPARRSARRTYSSAQLIEALEALEALPKCGVREMSFGQLVERREMLERARRRVMRYQWAVLRGEDLGRERRRLVNRQEDLEDALKEVVDWLDVEEDVAGEVETP